MKPKWTNVDYVKKHSRIDYDCEADLLELYIVSAEETLLNILNRTYDELMETYGDIPAPIRHATLLLVENSYAHRAPAEPTNLYVIPCGIGMMIKPYMKLWVTAQGC